MASRRARLILSDESGFGHLIAAVLVTGVLAGAVLVSQAGHVFADLHDAVTEWPKGKQERAAGGGGQAAVTTGVFIGAPQPPDGGRARECWLNVMSGHGIRWTQNGWRSAEHPEPVLSGDPATDRGTVSVWRDSVIGYVSSYASEAVDRCKSAGEETTTTETTEVVVDFSGSYAITVLASSCSVPPRALQVSISGSNLQVVVALDGGGSPTLAGQVSRGGSFSANFSGPITFFDEPATIVVRVLGQFDLDGTTAVIRSGSYSATFEGEGGTTCTVDFTARR